MRPLLVASWTPSFPTSLSAARIRPFDVEASMDPQCWSSSILPLLERACRRPRVHEQQTMAFEVLIAISPITSTMLTEPLLERAWTGPRTPSIAILPFDAEIWRLRLRGTLTSRLA
jgi:hypothetical protein